MTKDEALRLAIKALKTIDEAMPFPVAKLAIKECKAALEANEFNPDWDTQAVLTEEIQRMAKRIEELEANGEPVAGQPLPCPFCGHVGLNFAGGETYRWGVASCGGCGASCGDIRREYPDLGEWHTEAIAEWNRRSPTPQRKPLTDEQIRSIWNDGDCYEEIAFARAIEAAHGIGGKNESKNYL